MFFNLLSRTSIGYASIFWAKTLLDAGMCIYIQYYVHMMQPFKRKISFLDPCLRCHLTFLPECTKVVWPRPLASLHSCGWTSTAGASRKRKLSSQLNQRRTNPLAIVYGHFSRTLNMFVAKQTGVWVTHHRHWSPHHTGTGSVTWCQFDSLSKARKDHPELEES